MSNLSSIEMIKLEKLLGMTSGYVLDFSNVTFREFIAEYTGLDIYSKKYENGSGSKAYLLRAFIEREQAPIVGELLENLLEYWRTYKITDGQGITGPEQAIYEDCQKISVRLKQSVVENIDSLKPNTDDKDFRDLSKSIKESIEKNKPELALDRLHTFTVKYVRQLCINHQIVFDKAISLNALFGQYVKFLKESGLIESEMSERILKSSIAVLEAFNGVRNNHSLAHDNPVLNYNESVLIFNNISNIIRFIELVEQRITEKSKKQQANGSDWENIPYSSEEIEATGDTWIQSQIDISRGK